jgi:drug/metabolite transporter (DMT)-like permease
MTDIHTTTGRWKFGLLLTLIAATLWGILPTALKVLAANLDAITITWYRLFLAFLILFVFLSAKRALPGIGRLNQNYAILLAITCVGLCLNYIFYVIGLDIIGPGPAQLIIQLNVVFVIMGGIFIFKESFNRIQAIGLFAIITGLVLFFHNKFLILFSSMSEYTFGVIALIISALALATYSLAQKQLLVKFSSLQVSLMVFGTGALLLLPVSASSLVQVGSLNWPNLALLLFCVITTLGAFGSYAEALQHWETTKISAVLSMVPLLSLCFAELAVFLNPGLFSIDPITIVNMAGALILVLGSFLIVRKNS